MPENLFPMKPATTNWYRHEVGETTTASNATNPDTRNLPHKNVAYVSRIKQSIRTHLIVHAALSPSYVTLKSPLPLVTLTFALPCHTGEPWKEIMSFSPLTEVCASETRMVHSWVLTYKLERRTSDMP